MSKQQPNNNVPEWNTPESFADGDPSLDHHSTEVYKDPLAGATDTMQASDVISVPVPIEAFDQHQQPEHEKRQAETTTSEASNSKRRRLSNVPIMNPMAPSQVIAGKHLMPAASASVPSTRRVQNEQWDAVFERLRVYKETYGNCLVPKRFADDPKLGTWVETQRVQYKRLLRTQDESGREIVQPNTRLTAERLQKLESVGFVWVAKFIRKNTNKEESDGSTESATDAQQQRKQRLNEAQWEDMYQRLVRYEGQVGDCLVPRKFDPKLATWVETQRVLWNKEVKNAASGTAEDDTLKPKRLTPFRKQRLDALGFVWSLRNKRIEDHWDEMFRQLLDYKKVHGDCLVPSRFVSNLKLGKWVETQRYEYSKLQRQNAAASAASQNAEEGAEDTKPRATNPRLTKDRLQRLESIGFEWKVKNKMKRYYEKQWDQMLQRLSQFKKANGHCRVPKRYQEDTKLGTWVHTQRIQYRKLIASQKCSPATEEEVVKLLAGQNPSLTPEENAALKSCAKDEITYRLTEDRRKRLEDMDFVWSARDAEGGAGITGGVRNIYDDQWDNMLEKLREYKEKHGNCLVPKRYKENPKLGTWVDTQRVNYKKMKKILSSQLASSNAEEVGSPVAASESGKPLVGRLTNDRIQRLKCLGFVWSLRDDWQKHYEELKVYKAQQGHCNVPARYEMNRRLGIWVSAQRQQYKMTRQLPDATKGRRSISLTRERIALLNDLGFTWTIRSRDTFGESWNQRFEDLKEFKRIHGHCNVPSRYAENQELGVWVGAQRRQYRLYMKGREAGNLTTSSMNEDRMRSLESLGFSWVQRPNLSGSSSQLDDGLAAAGGQGDGSVDETAGMLDVDQISAMHQFPVENADQVMGEYVTQQEALGARH